MGKMTPGLRQTLIHTLPPSQFGIIAFYQRIRDVNLRIPRAKFLSECYTERVSEH